MNQRSQLLMRSKQQLKNQLLIGFRKKNKQENSNLQLTQPKSMNQIYQTPLNNNNNQKTSFLWQNKSVLDEFSRCPVREDQHMYTGQMVLNKFMFTKNRPILPINSAKPSVSVQTQKNIEGFTIPSENLFTKTRGTTKCQYENSKTPPKVANFDLKLDKSIIDVSGNLDNLDFPITQNNKQQSNRILSDSILGGLSSQNHQDSAQQLLRQLDGGRKNETEKDQSFKFKKTKSEVEVINQKKQPAIKKIQLNKYKNNKSQEIQPPPNKIKQQIKENKSQNLNFNQYNDQDQRDQKIEKLLSKKNVIKSMILNKDNKKQNNVKENSQPNPIITASKWSKIHKSKSQQQNKARLGQKNKMTELQQQIDPLDLLSPYENSSSGLQAVIQEENQSQLEESVKPKNTIAFQKSIIKDQAKKINKSQVLSLSNKIKKQQKNNQIQSAEKSLKQISIGDLSLQDVSQIGNVSQNKKLPDSLKKLISYKDINSSQLPQYQESQGQQHQKSKLDMQKYIVNDIANDIQTLKKKISNDASFDLQNQGHLKKNSSKGSEGPDKKMSSMLNFFDQLHDKLNFAQISKDIIDLRDKIVNQSQ